MEDMRKLKDMLCRELDEFSRRDSIESYDLDTIHKLTDTIKNLDKIEMLEDGGYSQARGGGNRGGMRTYARDGEGGGYSYEDSFGDNDGYSQARRGQHYVRGHYSRDDGRDDMVNRLEEMMSHVSSDRDREEIRRMIERMKGM
jgi:hypothetical protein